MTVSKRVLAIASMLAFALPSYAFAMELSLAIGQPGSFVSIRGCEPNKLHRSDTGEPLQLCLSGTTTMYFIPNNSPNPGTFELKFRLDDIPLEEQYSSVPDADDFFIGGTGVGDGHPSITDYKLGTGEGDFVEFSITVGPIPLSWGNIIYYTINGLPFTFWPGWSATVRITFVDPFNIADYNPPGDGGSLNDHWFRLSRNRFPDDFTEGSALPQYMYLESEPISGEKVTISGSNLIYRPGEAVTDSDGVFGVFAFVDPEAFTPLSSVSSESTGFARTVAEQAAAAREGVLSLTYEQRIQSRKITGHYCEVILLEGKATIVGGSGDGIKVGDILYPGTKLSLSSGWGSKTLLGLRFVNGSDCQLVQDVYTNSCITDLIVIGPTGFTNQSVIQGKTALMSASRYLCEEIAGMPNTPAEWTKAVGKLAIGFAASAAVPVPMGQEAAGYAVRYVTGTAAGKVYDYTITTITSNNDTPQSIVTPDVGLTRPAGTGAGDARVDLGTYFDGSIRITENISGAAAIYATSASVPLTSTVDGQWLELRSGVGRTFFQTPDSIDKVGPSLRMGYEHFPEVWNTQFELRAFDTAGLDLASLGVMSGGTNLTSSFEQRSPGVWSANFIGPYPGLYALTVTLRDKVGNLSTMNWSLSELPETPRNLSAEPPEDFAEKTSLRWTEPAGMTLNDVLMYEIRPYWQDKTGSWRTGDWISVGRVNEASLELPDGIGQGGIYYLDIRAYNMKGMAGKIARSEKLTAPSKKPGGHLPAILKLLLL